MRLHLLPSTPLWGEWPGRVRGPTDVTYIRILHACKLTCSVLSLPAALPQKFRQGRGQPIVQTVMLFTATSITCVAYKLRRQSDRLCALLSTRSNMSNAPGSVQLAQQGYRGYVTV